MLSINSLAYKYPSAKTPALLDINLEVNKASLFGLLGPNGAGKTTLMSLLSGKLKAPNNKIQLDGVDINHSNPQAISLIPQEYAFYENMTAFENLSFFANVQALPKHEVSMRINEVTAVTQLEEKLNIKAKHLSGGLKRRLNLAIGLLNKPQLLLLDEPTVGIDPHSRRFILEAIKNLNSEGTTVIYTTHYMDEVEYLCDQIAIIDHGKVLAQGSLPSLLANGNNRVITIELEVALTSTRLQTLQQHYEVKQHETTLILNTSSLKTELYQVFNHLEAVNAIIKQCHFGSENLEELFMQLTQRSLRD